MEELGVSRNRGSKRRAVAAALAVVALATTAMAAVGSAGAQTGDS